MIAVVGASGNTGKAVAEALLARGEKVRALGRSADKLAGLASKGADTALGDVTDAAYLTKAFAGAKAVYALIPPNAAAPDFLAYQNKVGEAITKAVADSGVKKVVFLSSLGADQPSGTGPIVGLHKQEERFKAIAGLFTISLRPGYFMENQFGSLPMIKHQGITGGAIKGDLPFPQIATADIAVAAVKALLDETGATQGFEVRELHGPRDLSLNEAAKILGARIGKPDLAYVQFPYEGFASALTQFGFSADVARLYAEMSQAFNEGKVKSLAGRSAATTTPTSFESFSEVLAGAYKAM
ncbi:MAG: NAD(P)H-binding protein [Deltaproteobacteria bacterium]|nr:NAD(P)H-binding protein [Deltaproteobacteria bacterium]